jgi:hypothetical protein
MGSVVEVKQRLFLGQEQRSANPGLTSSMTSRFFLCGNRGLSFRGLCGSSRGIGADLSMGPETDLACALIARGMVHSAGISSSSMLGSSKSEFDSNSPTLIFISAALDPTLRLRLLAGLYTTDGLLLSCLSEGIVR